MNQGSKVREARRDKINSNPGLGCPEPQITSHCYIYIEDHPSSTLTNPLHGYTRYLSSLYLSNVHRETTVTWPRFDFKRHAQSIALVIAQIYDTAIRE
ncbi:unnamed protein product [Lasius platythorax]|uniref:Uncharacterized protein n=1 Tax=Lasius platythorax TaxID=488582 RepID=A0AAV2P2G1_9HYME